MVELGDRSGGRGPPRCWRFGEFRLDAAERTLHHRNRPVILREKAFELLTLLVSRAPRLIEKEALRRELWPRLSVHDNNLAVTISALRKALQGHEPHTTFFETIPKRGYRWIHPLDGAESERGSAGRSLAEVGGAQGLPSAAQARGTPQPEPFVGRERELRWLLLRWESAEGAAPVLAFVSGEAGIGKTTLLQRFAAEVREQHPRASVAVGRCLELSGATEPYLPWLDVLDDLLSGPCAELWRRVLGEQAPSWAARLSLAGATEQRGQGRPPPSAFSVRELVQALGFAARERPLLLLLEDFHWADPSSVDVLRALGARAELRGLLVVVSFRSAQAQLQPTLLASLLEDLAARGRREELALAGWQPVQLEEYLAARFGGALGGRELARALWQQTEGLPFFATRLADALLSSSGSGAGAAPGSAAAAHALVGTFAPSSVPGIAALLRSQLRRVPEALQPLLQAASVAGPELSTSVLARVLCQLPAELERQLDRLAFEHGLLERVGESEPVPGVVAVRYRFRHVLLQKHVYEALDSHERRALHLRTARALLAAGDGSEASEHPALRALDAAAASGSPATGLQALEASGATPVALLRPARVAAHFGLGGQAASAVSFWTEAGDQAERAYAPREALSCYALAEELLPELPCEQRELRRLFLRHGQGWAWFNLRDLSRAEQCFADIARLAEELSRSDARCRELAHEYFTRPWSDELVRRTGNLLSPSSVALVPLELRAEALRCQCQILALGERSEALRDRAERLLQLGQAAQSPARVAEGECFLALVALNTGEVERARHLLTGALATARAGAYGRSQSLALHWLAELQLRQAELVPARELLLELLTQVPAAGDNAVALARLGDTLARLGELHEAFRAHERAAALFERMDPPRPPLHGWLLRELGRAEEALQLERAAVARARPLADSHRLTRLLASLASTCCRLGLLDEARVALGEAESEISREHQRAAARMHPLWDARCELELRRGDWQGVQELCERWLQLASAQRHVEGLMAAHRGLARAQLERGRLETARSQAVAAIELSKEHPIVLFDWRSHALLSEIERRSGDSSRAARSLAQARQRVRAIAERLEPQHRAAWLAAAASGELAPPQPPDSSACWSSFPTALPSPSR